MIFGGTKRDWQAFTLIELMVVLVLIGILTATIVPQMQGTYEEAILRANARRLVHACHLARSESVSSGARHRLRLDMRSERYMVERAGTSHETSGSFVPLEDTRGAEGKLDPEIAVRVRKPKAENGQQVRHGRSYALATEGPSDAETIGPTVLFYGDGTAEESKIDLRDRQGFGVGIRVDPVTGGVKVVSLERRLD